MITSIASQKGGTGKTTTSISVATGLARRGKRVLLIDMDSQANSSKVLLPDYLKLRKEDTIYRTVLENSPILRHTTTIPHLDIAPSHILLSNTDIELTVAKDHREARLKKELDKIRGNYDFVIIDCPPTLSWLTLNAFTASDSVLLVVAPGYFELDSIVQINKTIEEVRSYYKPTLRIVGYLFTMADPTINSQTSLKILRQAYGNDVLKTIIPRNTDIRDAHMAKQDIFSFSPEAKSAYAYNKLIDEVFYEQQEKN
jgi:chromosome partitioning protein